MVKRFGYTLLVNDTYSLEKLCCDFINALEFSMQTRNVWASHESYLSLSAAKECRIVKQRLALPKPYVRWFCGGFESALHTAELTAVLQDDKQRFRLKLTP